MRIASISSCSRGACSGHGMGGTAGGHAPSCDRLFRRQHRRCCGTQGGRGTRADDRAVVSRGGRPDLAFDDLPRVQAPTLLIVGGNDDVVIELNRMAYRELRAEKELLIIPGATHLFEEPGTLEQVATAAAHWFARHLAGKRTEP